jgi:hypothetical protein
MEQSYYFELLLTMQGNAFSLSSRMYEQPEYKIHTVAKAEGAAIEELLVLL